MLTVLADTHSFINDVVVKLLNDSHDGFVVTLVPSSLKYIFPYEYDDLYWTSEYSLRTYENIGIDIWSAGIRSADGNLYLLDITDYLTRYYLTTY